MSAGVSALAGVGPARRPLRARVRARVPVAPDLALFVIGCVVAFGVIMWMGRHNTFFFDEWTWVFTRRSGLHGILSAYNQQMMIVPSAVYQLLERVIGLRHFWVYRLYGTLAHLALATMVFVYARRRLGPVALVPIVPFLLLGTGAEDVLWPINAGFVLALAFGIGALLVLEAPDDEETGRRNAGAVGLLVAALLCSEVSLVFSVALAVELSWRDRSPRRAYVWLVPIALYGLWYLGYGRASNVGSGLVAIPGFAARMAAAASGGLFGLGSDWGWPLLVAGVALLVVRLVRAGPPAPRLVAVLAAPIVYWLLVAYGRDSDPGAQRYVYVGVVLLILLGSEAARGVRPTAMTAVIGAVLAAFSLWGNVRTLTNAEGSFRHGSELARAELGALDVARRTALPAEYIDPTYLPGMTALLYFQTVAALHSTPADPPDAIRHEGATAAAAADALLLRSGDLVAGPVHAGPQAGPRAHSASDSGSGSGSGSGSTGGCRTLPPGATVSLPQPGVSITATGAGAVNVEARRFAPAFDPAPVAVLRRGQAIRIAPVPDGAPRLPWSLRIARGGPARVCPASV